MNIPVEVQQYYAAQWWTFWNISVPAIAVIAVASIIWHGIKQWSQNRDELENTRDDKHVSDTAGKTLFRS
jgi:hypothetical protein